tara:strand:- start:535 stop:849 length:315 start_codon:yes stop_codon:yes gene_type:complete
MENPKAWKENRKAALSTIDQTAFAEILLKQFNYMRMKGIDLAEELDQLVNWYLWICKKFPKPDEKEADKPAATKKSEAPKKTKANASPTPAKSKAPAKKKTADK